MRIVAATGFIPFIAWGIFALRRRYRFHEELSPLLEGTTVFLVALFFAFELAQLRLWLYSQPGIYIFTVLGMLVAGVALYGHMVISLISRVIVDVVVPGHDATPDQPRLGPAEYLERCRDYASALEEYLVIGRIYPRNPLIHVRIAENLLRLSRPEEAATWLERALTYLPDAAQSLPVTTRLCEVYARHLHRLEEARRVLDQYLEQYPDAPETALVREHLAQLEGVEAPGALPGLVRLDEAPLRDEAPELFSESGEEGRAGGLPELERLDGTPVEESPEDTRPIPAEEYSAETPAPAIELDAFGSGLGEEPGADAGERRGDSPSIEPL